ncbi:NAD/NADP octopine/nopaline dehydrogenase family protein [Virgibacillus pantothenticus]|uniref:NAD/NADP octopine/nopaline dehydrogenase family protein n=1 Tax=Virgibacillus pantothenticus TaxID=1473 RepID=UPI00147F606F|nr:NAD/NADP-dependent octopine/nopaline dehydrogenase family protein [Virgibacillus pantothenticus]
MTIQFGIIGAGNGGHAYAAYLGLKGYPVHWYDIDQEVVDTLNQQGGVYTEGKLTGFAPIQKATTTIKETIDASDVLLIIAPANAHRIIAKNCAPYLRDDQIIILNPGSTGGSLEFHYELQQQNCKADVILAETQSLLFACRLKKTGSVQIFGIKRNLGFAALPASKTDHVFNLVSAIFPEWVRGTNILEITLENVNAILHPAPSLFNLNSIDSRRSFLHYTEGITPNISSFIETLDEERRKIGAGYGLELSSTKDLLEKFYGVKGDTIEETVQKNEAYQSIKGAESLANRYFMEDIPMGLVPMSELAKVVDIPTPNIDAMIDLLSTVLKQDFRTNGRTIDKLGLTNMNKEAIIQFVEHGTTKTITNY